MAVKDGISGRSFVARLRGMPRNLHSGCAFKGAVRPGRLTA